MNKSMFGLLLMPFAIVFSPKSWLRKNHLFLIATLAMSASACDGLIQPMCYDPADPIDSISNDTIPQDTISNETRIQSTQKYN